MVMSDMERKISPYIIFILLAVAFQALSGIFSKYASLSLGNTGLMSILLNHFYLIAVLCLVLQALVWQIALKHYDLSFAYPFIGLVSIIILFSSYFLFGESITLANLLGILLITVGIYFLSKEGASA